MSKVKDLLQAIISGEGYNEAFKAVMAEKISMRLEEKKLLVAQSIFNEAKMCDCESCEKGSDGKCDVCGGKMKNESIELDERELTPEEMKKREKYVLSMKKNMADFEKRYGSRAKEVMYATATKMAKGEMKDSVEIEEFLYSLDEKFEKEKVDYFKPEESKVAGKRYSEVASALKQKRQKPLLKATPSGMIKSSFEDSSDLIDEELKGNQHKLDVDQDGEIEAEDLAKLRAKKKKKANDKV